MSLPYISFVGRSCRRHIPVSIAPFRARTSFPGPTHSLLDVRLKEKVHEEDEERAEVNNQSPADLRVVGTASADIVSTNGYHYRELHL